MKNIEQCKAKELRSQGMSIKTIAKELGVSAGSVSVWVRDIELSPEQIETLKSQNAIYDNQHKGAKARQLQARQQRLRYQEEGRIKAREKDPLHMAGCMLY
jgi:predicted transcriptional regulator